MLMKRFVFYIVYPFEVMDMIDSVGLDFIPWILNFLC